MLDPSTVALFLAASLALLVIPGPAVTYIVARSIDQGRAAGLVSTLGIGVGSLVHVVAAALGLSAILVSSATAFTVVKLGGAAYLVFLGVRRLLAREDGPEPLVRERRLSRVFGQGVVVNVLNPKTALFFFAFLPQFVRPSRGPVSLQVLLLGSMFVVLGLVSDGTYALMAARLGGWLRRRAGFRRAQRLVSGGLLVSLGVASAVSGSRASS